ncbi:MAG: 2-amino-4-hydroxy-6-hydroxymethyldihydropteridine diphosphokinase [Cytophagales bacterium]|nr:2-amino-4-hydroxy-6-hydroxymethyldihydropteridine diphosphokinase [Cytophagales bacterium]
MTELYLLSGSNLGDREKNLKNALSLINNSIGKIVIRSKIYETEPWGVSDQPLFLNQVIKALTGFSPDEVLQKIKKIEEGLGRKKRKKWAERIIDIDMLYYDNLVINTQDLKIPHPEIINRKFTLAPLTEIAPDFIHPVANVINRVLYEKCEDTRRVYVHGA